MVIILSTKWLSTGVNSLYSKLLLSFALLLFTITLTFCMVTDPLCGPWWHLCFHHNTCYCVLFYSRLARCGPLIDYRERQSLHLTKGVIINQMVK